MMLLTLTLILCVNAAPLDKYIQQSNCVNSRKNEMKNHIQTGISVAECGALCDKLAAEGCLSFEYNEPRQECRPQRVRATNKCKNPKPGDTVYTLPRNRKELTTTAKPVIETDPPTTTKAAVPTTGVDMGEDKFVEKAHCVHVADEKKFAESASAVALEAFLVSEAKYCGDNCLSNADCNIAMTMPHAATGKFICQLAQVPAGVVAMEDAPEFAGLQISRCFKEKPGSKVQTTTDEPKPTTTDQPADKMVCEALAGATEMPGNCRRMFWKDSGFQDLGEVEYECQHATGCNAVETSNAQDGTLGAAFYSCQDATPAPEDNRCTLYASKQKIVSEDHVSGGSACLKHIAWAEAVGSVSDCADKCQYTSGCNALQVSKDDNGKYRCVSYICPASGVAVQGAAPCANDDSVVQQQMPAVCSKLGKKVGCPRTCEGVYREYNSDACRDDPNFYWFADACPFLCPQSPVKCLRESDEVYECEFEQDLEAEEAVGDLYTCSIQPGIGESKDLENTDELEQAVGPPPVRTQVASEMTMTQQTTSWTVNDLGLYSFAAVGLGFVLHAGYKLTKTATAPKTVEFTPMYTA